jgi:hypothetical protein
MTLSEERKRALAESRNGQRVIATWIKLEDYKLLRKYAKQHFLKVSQCVRMMVLTTLYNELGKEIPNDDDIIEIEGEKEEQDVSQLG